MTEHEEMAEQIAALLAVRLAAGSGNRHAGRGSVRTGMDARQPTKAVCAAGGDEERGLAGRAAVGHGLWRCWRRCGASGHPVPANLLQRDGGEHGAAALGLVLRQLAVAIQHRQIESPGRRIG